MIGVFVIALAACMIGAFIFLPWWATGLILLFCIASR